MVEREFDRVIKLYEQGFRCIKYENVESGEFRVLFKNFKDEKIDSLVCSNKDEIIKIKQYIDNY